MSTTISNEKRKSGKALQEKSTSSSRSNHLEKKSDGGFKQNFLGLLILTLLYMIQGISLSFFKMTIPALLVDKGAHFKDLGFLSIMGISYSLKFLVAPILDTFYFQRFGQRKSYIIPLQYLFAFSSFILSFKLKEYIESNNIHSIFFWGFLLILISAIQDVAVDGWVLTILTKDYLSYGPATQTIGIMLGSTLAYNIFIPLNSTYFCNTYLFSTARTEPVLSIEGFWNLIGVFVFAVTIFIHFFIKEKKLQNEERISLNGVLNIVLLFYRNPNLRKLSLLNLTQFISSMPIVAFFDAVLIKNGIHKETLANMSTMLFPIEIILSILVGKICKENKELKISYTGYLISLGKTFFQLFIIWYFLNGGNFYSVLVMVIISSILNAVQKQIAHIAFSSFSNKISTEAAGTTFLSTRAALGNVGISWVRSTSLFLGEFLPWEVVCSSASIFGVFYLFWFKKTINHLQSKTKEEFYTQKQD